MNNKQIFREILKERECLRRRLLCDKKCSECDINIDFLDADSALNNVIDILKARDPELYFANELDELRRSLENVD